MTAAAATRVRIYNRRQYDVLRAYALGEDLAQIIAKTRFPQDLVVDVVGGLASSNRMFAKTLVQQYEYAEMRRGRRLGVVSDGASTVVSEVAVQAPSVDVPARVGEVGGPSGGRGGTAPGWLVATWPAWRCDRCGHQATRLQSAHGEPACSGAPEPVQVTITRRSA